MQGRERPSAPAAGGSRADIGSLREWDSAQGAPALLHFSLAAFRAVAKGVIVVSVARNRGLDRSSVRNDASWHFIVSAGSMDGRIPGDLVLEDGDLVEGEALVQGVNVNQYFPCTAPARVTGSAWAPFGCQESLRQRYNTGGDHHPGEKGPHIVPARLRGVNGAGAATGQKIREYCQYPDAAAKVSFRGTLVNVGGAPMVAAFSSRGPSRNNPFIIKPDILAPGMNILAAGTE
ncbi:hypothetical protein QYE76_004306 [Lolium multiflorum]|uniref:Peptidase S8/S53 domain-containing protein n=1 Tax=Lolium multiflorum TaxID=4521 RepID=A0AAD8RQD6_LOLMU|nr:hypothetical protein QYE76_004306 [Lolium multiflorum]